MIAECVEFIVTTLYKNTLSGRTGGYPDDDLIKLKKTKTKTKTKKQGRSHMVRGDVKITHKNIVGNTGNLFVKAICTSHTGGHGL